MTRIYGLRKHENIWRNHKIMLELILKYVLIYTILVLIRAAQQLIFRIDINLFSFFFHLLMAVPGWFIFGCRCSIFMTQISGLPTRDNEYAFFLGLIFIFTSYRLHNPSFPLLHTEVNDGITGYLVPSFAKVHTIMLNSPIVEQEKILHFLKRSLSKIHIKEPF